MVNFESPTHTNLLVLTPHAADASLIFQQLGSSALGLSDDMARERLRHFGLNKLKEEKGYSISKILVRQFTNFLVLILIGAGTLSLAAGEIIDTIAIFAIIVLNGLLGFVQEFKAEQSLAALKKIETLHASVLRNGESKELDASQLVPGDVINLTEGIQIPADARLIETHSLTVDESMLTGESVPVNKITGKLLEQTSLADRKNMVFSGSHVTKGRGTAVVVFTGEATELGKIAHAIQIVKTEPTPLQKALTHLGKILGIVAIFVVIPSLIIGVVYQQDLLEVMIMAISLAVSAIPEGLPIVVTIALALGIRRMATINILIRKLATAETLGGTEIVCTDKTGTITHNQMTIRQLYIPGSGMYQISGNGYSTTGQIELTESGSTNSHLDLANRIDPATQLLLAATLCSDATLEQGDPTERAFVVALAKSWGNTQKINQKHIRLDEIPFNSEEKFMAVAIKEENRLRAIIKGAPSRVLEMCTNLTSNDREKFLAISDEFAGHGLRVLAVAQKNIQATGEMAMLSNYEFIGLAAMEDPPREAVKNAIATTQQAGVRVIMLTGDHPKTAEAIALEIGLLNPNSTAINRIVTGLEIEQMNEEEFQKTVQQVNVFARVSPQNKLQVLKALQAMGHSVGMTGDGVNDAPSVKTADIGIAMGTGTDLTKGVSDMILLDDNFATIVEGIREGRRIFYNIKKFVRFLLSANFDEIALIFSAIILGLETPLVPLQILWINLATDSLPALALTSDVAEPGIMQEKPYNPSKEIISGVVPFAITAALVGFISSMTLFLLATYIWDLPIAHARTLVFTTTVIFELFLVFSIRSTKSALSVGIFSNKTLWLAVCIGVISQIVVIYNPLAQEVFQTVALGVTDWLYVVGFASSGFLIIEMFKIIRKLFHSPPATSLRGVSPTA